jgi:hypothetical protein
VGCCQGDWTLESPFYLRISSNSNTCPDQRDSVGEDGWGNIPTLLVEQGWDTTACHGLVAANPRSVRRVCAAIDGGRRPWKARWLWLVWRGRYLGQRHSDNFECSFRTTFSYQLLNKSVPTIRADVVFFVIDYSLRTISNFVAQIASVHQHDSTSPRYYCRLIHATSLCTRPVDC